jgi:hypothetical protein
LHIGLGTMKENGRIRSRRHCGEWLSSFIEECSSEGLSGVDGHGRRGGDVGLAE